MLVKGASIWYGPLERIMPTMPSGKNCGPTNTSVQPTSKANIKWNISCLLDTDLRNAMAATANGKVKRAIEITWTFLPGNSEAEKLATSLSKYVCIILAPASTKNRIAALVRSVSTKINGIRTTANVTIICCTITSYHKRFWSLMITSATTYQQRCFLLRLGRPEPQAHTALALANKRL